MLTHLDIDFNELIDFRKDELQKRISILEEHKDKLKVEDPITFSISRIGNEIIKIPIGNEKSIVYYYQLDEIYDKDELIAKLAFFRSKKNMDEYGKDLRRATARLPKEIANNSSDVLYVGSVKSNFRKRFREHLGLGSKSTYSMQLKYWAPESLKLKCYFIEVEKDLTTDLEVALAKKLRPLIGKTEI